MVQVMETWFVGNRQILKAFFGQHFAENALPPAATPIEMLGKEAVFVGLKTCTRDCKPKGQYGKGDHSFKLLGQIDPAVVLAASPWAKRFVDLLRQKMG
jgi:hypothetical protein